MDREAGTQIAIHDSVGYGSHSFHQNHLAAGNGYGNILGSKQAGVSARYHSGTEECSAYDYPGPAQWRGFTSFSLPKGPSTTGNSLHFLDADGPRVTRASDLTLDVADSAVSADVCTNEQSRKRSLLDSSYLMRHVGAPSRESHAEEDPAALSLKLSFPGADDASNGTRNLKRFRPSSPGNQAPVCQVDDCHMDLKHAKDYHRRHKVCPAHSKAPQSLVQNVLQRFCQQCSRFHPLPQFDEGKRSCRRRLDGHNKRRRKSDMTTSSAPLSEVVKGTDQLIGLVALLTQLQAAKAKGKPDGHGVEYESVLQSLRKPAPSANLPPVSSPVVPQSHQPYGRPPQSNRDPQKASSSPLEAIPKDTLFLLLRNALQNQVAAPQGRSQLPKTPSQLLSNDQNAQSLQANAGNISENNSRNLPDDSMPIDLAGKLKSSGEPDVDMCSRQAITKQYLGHTDSFSNEGEDPDSPPNSTSIRPLEEQNLFPIECGEGFRSAGAGGSDRTLRNSVLDFSEEDLNLSPQSLQPDFDVGVDKPNLPPSDSSEYGSDHSPSSSSSNEEGAKKNGRIIFKLCDPQHVETMTQTHESEIQQWLSLKPCCLEGYLRPGCILLTVFLSMPQRAWEKLVTNLPANLEKLVCLSQSDIWKKGRIVVQVGHQRAIIVNGRVKKIRFSRTSKVPHLRAVRPLAIVAGQEVTLSVYGDNFVPETRIVCVYNGRYILREVPFSTPDAMSPDSRSTFSRCSTVQEIHFPGGPPNVLGRCFVEVEHGFMGNALPVIVANKEICLELQSLEVDLASHLAEQSEQRINLSIDEVCAIKEAEAMSFLHELGWIFQSTSEWSYNIGSDGCAAPEIGLSRFKGVLKYAILRDWCSVVKQLLDLLFVVGAKDDAEILRILSEIHLLHEAVKRKCRPMVDLLVHYKPVRKGTQTQSIFRPAAGGPGGFTPLHVAASMSDAEQIIDALTEDPSEEGLHGWKSACDQSGQTPEWYAWNGGKLLYIDLVNQKLLRKRSPSVKITILNEEESLQEANLKIGSASTLKAESVGSTAIELSDLSRRGVSSSALTCRDCRKAARCGPFRSSGQHFRMYRPLMMMMVAVATICATVALLYKTGPMLDCVVYTLKWEGIMYGSV